MIGGYVISSENEASVITGEIKIILAFVLDNDKNTNDESHPPASTASFKRNWIQVNEFYYRLYMKFESFAD